ncbi:MAG: glycine zipper domain-containing protein [Reyranellaceae bacterium]
MLALMQSRSLRAVIASLLCVPLLAGCVDNGANDPGLTPEQRRIRAQRAEQDRTVGGGAVAGAILGGLIGLAVGGNNRGAAAAVGAVAGAALGGATGDYFAKRQQQYVNEFVRLDAMTGVVQVEIQQLAQYVADSRVVVAQDKADLARLRSEYANRRASRADLDRRIAIAEQDAQAIQRRIAAARKQLGEFVQARQQTPGAGGARMDGEIARLNSQIAQLEAQLNDLNTSISVTRTG